jgi:drug/metabolite transporter (DMT)-like permease
VNTARFRAYAYLLTVTIIWGLAAPIIKYSLRGFDPGTFLVYRFCISAVIAVVYICMTKNYKGVAISQNLPQVFIFGLLGTTVSLGALFMGLDRTSVLDVNIITSITPLLIVLAGAIVFKEKVPSREKFGALLAFSGTVIAVVLPVITGTQSTMHLTGDALIILHMVSDIASILMLKRLLRKKVSTSFLASISFIIGFITLTPFVLLNIPLQQIINNIITTPLQYHAGVWYMAILSGTVAYFLRNKAQKTVEVGKAGIFGYLNPVFSTPLAVLWLGEKITPAFILGAILIIFGVLIAEINSSARKRIHLHIPHFAHHR